MAVPNCELFSRMNKTHNFRKSFIGNWIISYDIYVRKIISTKLPSFGALLSFTVLKKSSIIPSFRNCLCIIIIITSKKGCQITWSRRPIDITVSGDYLSKKFLSPDLNAHHIVTCLGCVDFSWIIRGFSSPNILQFCSINFKFKICLNRKQNFFRKINELFIDEIYEWMTFYMI